MAKTIYRYTNSWGTANAFLVHSKYVTNDGLAVEIITDTFGDWEPYGEVTVNFGFASERYAYVDVNNMPNITEFLEENGLAKPTGLEYHSGYCVYPMYEFTDKFFAESDAYEEE